MISPAALFHPCQFPQLEHLRSYFLSGGLTFNSKILKMNDLNFSELLYLEIPEQMSLHELIIATKHRANPIIV
jgi:hypothetical protein